MENFLFDDTETSGIWWSTNLAIRDACAELKKDTSCADDKIIQLLNSIAESIKIDGL